MLIVPTAVYTEEVDFSSHAIGATNNHQRIAQVAREVVGVFPRPALDPIPTSAEKVLTFSHVIQGSAVGVNLTLFTFLHFREEVGYFGRHVIPLAREMEADQVPLSKAA